MLSLLTIMDSISFRNSCLDYTVLIVDDPAFDRTIIESALRKKCRVDFFARVKGCLARLSETAYSPSLIRVGSLGSDVLPTNTKPNNDCRNQSPGHLKAQYRVITAA